MNCMLDPLQHALRTVADQRGLIMIDERTAISAAICGVTRDPGLLSSTSMGGLSFLADKLPIDPLRLRSFAKAVAFSLGTALRYHLVELPLQASDWHRCGTQG